MRDGYIQREDERMWDDEQDRRRLLLERADRLTERASLEPWQARMEIDALQPDLGHLPDLRYRGTRHVHVGFWRRAWRALGLAGFLALVFVLALALAVFVFLGVAWALADHA